LCGNYQIEVNRLFTFTKLHKFGYSIIIITTFQCLMIFLFVFLSRYATCMEATAVMWQTWLSCTTTPDWYRLVAKTPASYNGKSYKRALIESYYYYYYYYYNYYHHYYRSNDSSLLWEKINYWIHNYIYYCLVHIFNNIHFSTNTGCV